MEKTRRQRLFALLLAMAICFSNFVNPPIDTYAAAASAQMEPSSMSDTGPLATSSGVISGSNLNQLWPGTYTATNGRITLNDKSYEGTFADASGYFTRDDFQIMAVYVQPAGETTATKLGSQYATSYNGGLVASYSVGYYRNYYDTPQEGYLDYRLVVTAVGDGDIWFYVKDHVGYSVYHITCSVTPTTHNVYFYTVEAQAPTTVTVNSGAQVPQNRIPSVSDYQDTDGVTQKFIGWSETENNASNLLSAEAIAARSITADTTFYAVYAAQYGVTYQTGTDVQITDAAKYTLTESVTINADNVLLSKDGYTFASWSVADAYQNVIATTTQLSGATFAMPMGEAVVTANWDLISYPITYDLDGGTDHSANPTSYHIESGIVSLQDPSKTGYTFWGWTSEALDITSPLRLYRFNAMFTKGDLDFTAHWTINRYDVTFTYVDESGTPISVFQDETVSRVTYGTTLGTVIGAASGLEKTHTNYSFSGYYLGAYNGNQIDATSDAQVVGATTVYLVYQSIPCTVTVVYQDESGNVIAQSASQEIAYGAAASAVNIVQAEIYGYTYKETQDVLPDTITEDITVTLVYTTNEYPVSFGYAADDASVAVQALQDELVGLSYDVVYKNTLKSVEGALVPSLTAQIVTDETTYTFSHWATVAGAEISLEDIVSLPVTKAVGYYAVYTAVDTLYTVSFVDYNGDALQEPAQYPWGAVPAQPENEPTRAPSGNYTYEFAGWDNEVVAVSGDATYTATYLASYVGTTVTPTATPAITVTPTTPTTPVTPEAPATPEPPTTPITPATPALAVATPAPTAPADTQVELEDAAVPLAPTQSPSVEIEDEEIPMVATVISPSWALMNLILAIGTISVSLILLVGYIFSRRDSEYQGLEDDAFVKHNGLLRVISIFPAAVSVVVFLLTENMKNPMVLLDQWTLVMALIALIQFAIVLKVRRDDGVNRDDDLADLCL